MIGSSSELRQAIADVAAGRVKRVTAPGRWVVFLKDDAAKPRLRVFA